MTCRYSLPGCTSRLAATCDQLVCHTQAMETEITASHFCSATLSPAHASPYSESLTMTG
jgi:hypothetical protein